MESYWTAQDLLVSRSLEGSRRMALAILTLCLISLPFVVGIAFALDRGLGLRLIAITTAIALYQGGMLLLVSTGRYRPWLDWWNTAVEVSIPTMIAIVDTNRLGPAYALTTAPVMIYCLAATCAALRLRPILALFSGTLGAIELTVLYLVVRSGLSPQLVQELPSLSASNVMQRAAYVFFSGLTGYWLCRTLQRLVDDIMANQEARRVSQEQARALEDKLRHAQKMEAVGRLAGGVAHDFNNFLTAIIGCAEYLKGEASADSQHSEALDDILSASHRAASLTRQLLTFSRKQPLAPRVLDLNEAVMTAKRLVARTLGEEIELVVKTSASPSHVRADPAQLEQVMLNLAVNARDAMDKCGRIVFETSNAPSDPQEAADAPLGWVVLTVTDNGHGISPEVLPHIFEPFFTTKEQGRGTGLGLSSVYGIVEQCRGRISVESAPEQSTQFRICLPAVAEERTTLTPRPPSVSPRGAETVLLVEDEEQVRSHVRRLLERGGYKVIVAVNGVDGLARFEENKGIDLLLTDVAMPKMGGRELYDQLALRPNAPKVLFMSAYMDARHAVPSSDMPFIAKPFTSDALMTKVREVLDRKTAGHGT
ncbi:MAG: response regulator [Deltaproteobacteria bacterium]|nr:response regulator [Deltaproteobacteria bacterium]